MLERFDKNYNRINTFSLKSQYDSPKFDYETIQSSLVPLDNRNRMGLVGFFVKKSYVYFGDNQLWHYKGIDWGINDKNYFLVNLSESYTNFPIPICDKGHYYETIQNSCNKCPSGTFKDIISLDYDCQECSNNSISLEFGSDSLSDCLPIKGYQLIHNSLIECPQNTFKDKIGHQSCQDCPNNTYTLSDGSESISDCIENKIDTNQNHNHSSTDNQGETINNKLNCSKGYFVNHNKTDCIQCPDESTTKYWNAQTITDCLANRGYYFDYYDNDVKKCPIGTYKSVSLSNKKCDDCLNSNTKNIGSSSIYDCYADAGFSWEKNKISQCPIGTYKDKWLSNEKCIVCPKFTNSSNGWKECLGNAGYEYDKFLKMYFKCEYNMYKDRSLSNDRCKICDIGKYSDLQGATSCKECNYANYEIQSYFCPPNKTETTNSSLNISTNSTNQSSNLLSLLTLKNLVLLALILIALVIIYEFLNCNYRILKAISKSCFKNQTIEKDEDEMDKENKNELKLEKESNKITGIPYKLFICFFALADFILDIVFASSVTIPVYRTISIIVIICSLITGLIMTSKILQHIRHKNYVNTNLMIDSKFSIIYSLITLLSISKLDLLILLPYTENSWKGFPDKKVLSWTLFSTFIEDLPQIILQILYLNESNKNEIITILSLGSSFCYILLITSHRINFIIFNK